MTQWNFCEKQRYFPVILHLTCIVSLFLLLLNTKYRLISKEICSQMWQSFTCSVKSNDRWYHKWEF